MDLSLDQINELFSISDSPYHYLLSFASPITEQSPQPLKSVYAESNQDSGSLKPVEGFNIVEQSITRQWCITVELSKDFYKTGHTRHPGESSAKVTCLAGQDIEQELRSFTLRKEDWPRPRLRLLCWREAVTGGFPLGQGARTALKNILLVPDEWLGAMFHSSEICGRYMTEAGSTGLLPHSY
jgi:hypothetical protein